MAAQDQDTMDIQASPQLSEDNDDAEMFPDAEIEAGFFSPPVSQVQTQPQNAAANSSSQMPTREFVHPDTGYKWSKEEDSPGYLWKNKRAQEEALRAWDQVVEKERMIGRKYGDIAPSK